MVIDSSITLSWFFPDEETPASSAVLDEVSTQLVVVPIHWRLEVANVLAMAERKGRTSRPLVDRFLLRLDDFQIEVDDGNAAVFSAVLELARKHTLTTYDAAYLHLAQSRGCPLATLDKALREACTNVGVHLRGV